MRTICTIQYLRAAAAFSILFFHLSIQFGPGIAVAEAGVDLFFVISGFILATMTLRRDLAPGDFLWQRVARVVPLYWLITLCLAVPGLLAAPDPSALAARAWRAAASLLFIPHRNDAGAIYPLFIPGWTLNHEMFFYLWVAATLRLPRAARLPALLAALVGLCLIGFVAAPGMAALQAWTSPLLLEFAAGAVLGALWLRRLVPGRATGCALLAGGIGALALTEMFVPHAAGWRVIPWGIPATMIVLGALALEPAREPRLLVPLRVLGDASYSIYLLHPMVVLGVLAALGREQPVLAVLAAMAVTAAAGVVTFQVFERTATRALRGLRHGTAARSVS